MEAIRKGLRDSARYIPLLREMVKRDFKMKYKRSYLGIVWSLLDPLLHMLILALVFSQLLGRDIQFFPVYIMTGRLIFTFYSQATNFCLTSITGGKLYIMSVKMPLYMLPLSKTISALVNEALSLLALLFMMLITGAPFHWTALMFPVPVLYVFLFSFGLGMALSAWMVFFRDLGHLYSVFTTLLMFITPMFYSADIYPQQYLWAFKLNPLYHFVQMFRNIVLYGHLPPLTDHAICAAYCAGALIVGAAAFKKGKNRFVLYL
ncbi:MAG: ABC transporter permease [Oscillospiraceae bacterium]|nr:ABC transporter permease [Oscillospiraceae bacterium]